MFLTKNLGNAAAAVAAEVIEAEELGILSLNGRLLTADLSEDQETAIASIRDADSYIGGLIADADDYEVGRNLSFMKNMVASFETDIVREHMRLNTCESVESHEEDAKANLQRIASVAITESQEQEELASSENSSEGDTEDATQERKTRRRKRN